jgi:hypothetical protein
MLYWSATNAGTDQMRIKLRNIRPHLPRGRRSNHTSPISLRMRWRQRISAAEKVAK